MMPTKRRADRDRPVPIRAILRFGGWAVIPGQLPDQYNLSRRLTRIIGKT